MNIAVLAPHAEAIRNLLAVCRDRKHTLTHFTQPKGIREALTGDIALLFVDPDSLGDTLFDWLTELRQHSPNLPLALLTNQSFSAEEISRFHEIQFLAYVGKPGTHQDLKGVLAKLD